MSVIQAIILGVVQAVTGFLPIGSSGNITIVSHIIGVDQLDLMFLCVLRLGTLVALALNFYPLLFRLAKETGGMCSDCVRKVRTSFGHNDENVRVLSNNNRRFVFLLMISLIFTLIIGANICTITEIMCGNLLATGMGLLVTALLLFVSSFMNENNKTAKEAKAVDAIIIGAFEGFSAFIGISHIGMSFASGIMSGFNSKFLKKYCYILSICTIIAAFVFEGFHSGSFIPYAGLLPALIGFLVSAVLSTLIMRFAMRLLKRKNTFKFAIYCIAAGVLSMILYLI